MTNRPVVSGFKAQLVLSIGILLAMFVIEYPPIFAVGYWGWGALVHKVLSGVLIAVNLVITQFLVRRLGFFRAPGVTNERDPPAGVGS